MTVELEAYLPRPIKEVMTEFPALINILNEYDIGCGSCMVGTCLLKDIVSIHDLPPEKEHELMARIAGVITSTGPIEISQPSPSTRPKEERTYSPPIKKLVEEHILIKKLLALIPEIITKLDLTTRKGKEIVAASIDFIRSYADCFHHGKEEAILFKYFDENSEIIQAMESDHEAGRRHVRAIREALEKGDGKAICTHLQGYRELLLDHIKKEDETLFPWMDRTLSAADKDTLVHQFADAEKELGNDLSTYYEKIIAFLEQETK